jgi:prevent-host-death family protein
MAKTATVGVRELKTRLGGYLERVRRGQRLIVTDRGEPVAEIRPLSDGGSEEAAWDRLVTLGLVSRGTPGPLPDVTPLSLRNVNLSRAIIEDREDRF